MGSGCWIEGGSSAHARGMIAWLFSDQSTGEFGRVSGVLDGRLATYCCRLRRATFRNAGCQQALGKSGGAERST